MSVFQRIQDIISANLNDMLEGLENPEQLLRQAIREMEQAIEHARPDVARALASDKLIGKALGYNESQCRTWQNRAVEALHAGDEELARKALARKLEYEKVVAALNDQLQEAQEASHMLKRQLDAMEAKLADAQRRLCTLVARSRAADMRARMARVDAEVRLDHGNAFAKFDRLERKVERAEAEAEALAELARKRNTFDDESPVAGDFRQIDVDRELALLKKQVGS